MSKKIKTAIIILVLIIVGVFIYYYGKPEEPAENIPQEQAKDDTPPVLISKKTIKEENFTGEVAAISGKGAVALRSQSYVEEQVDEFRKQANMDVPGMREEFGADSPTANYEIDIEAKYLPGEKTESVVMNVYTYTGGAHGSSSYKVFTGSLPEGKILALSDIIKKDQQSAFTAFVKKELTSWRPEGSTGSVVFPEDVEALTFSSFTNWSLDDKNLTLYFSQYEIGPGALGAVAFPVPLSKIKNFLELNYD